MENDSLSENISFPKDIFIQDDFNVDRFLQEHCSKSGLHKLHKELGIYIKHLQSMMIDIVNAESGAIVNLSSDLKVLQSKFANLSTPLGQLREEVSQIHKVIDSNLTNMNNLIAQKHNIASFKSSKINELRVLVSSQKISRILMSHIYNNTIDMEVLERSVDQYILQQMYSQNCNFNELKSQICQSTDVLNQILSNVFLQSVIERHTENTIRCLQMYMLMNTQSTAEDLYRNKVCRPALLKIISEGTLKKCNGNLSELYTKIIEFVQTNMKPLLNVVAKSHGISGYNFLLNSGWLEIHEQLKLNMASVYAPGNPSVFHQRFTQTCVFLSDFEKCFLTNSGREEYLKHPTYSAHKQQWNLPVYYEIRHLEVVQRLEELLPKNISRAVFSRGENHTFRLIPCCHIWTALFYCFDPDVYLPQLLDKFWRLNLQIISRFCTWLQYLLRNNIPIKEEAHLEGEGPTYTKFKFLTCLYLDIILFSNKLANAFDGGLQYLNVVPDNFKELFMKCLVDPHAQLQAILASIEEVIVNIVYKECSVHVKQISQIPRLFRKTNRSTPIGPSSYVTQMTKPIDDFLEKYKNQLEEKVMKRILGAIHTKIITEYKSLVEGVLTSVTKTEESLRRLKKLRTNTTEPSVITDDQKIRLQVQLDVSHYYKEAERYAGASSIKALLSLIKETDHQESK